MYKKWRKYKQISKLFFEIELGVDTYEICFQPIHICITKDRFNLSIGLLALRFAFGFFLLDNETETE